MTSVLSRPSPDELARIAHDACWGCKATRLRCYVRPGMLSAPLCGGCLEAKRREMNRGAHGAFAALHELGSLAVVPSLRPIDLFSKTFRRDAADAVLAWLALPETS